MKSSILAVVAFASMFSLVGCAAQTDETDGAADDSVVTGSKATITTKKIDTKSGKCTTSATDLVVQVPSAAVSKAINAALTTNRTTAFSDTDCSVDAFSWESTMTVKANAKGILSIEESGYSSFEHEAHDAKFIIGHNFDLRTGKELTIKDVLTSAGIAKATTACDAAMRKAAKQYDADGSYEGECASALKEQYGPASFSIEKGGIRIHPEMGTAAFVLELEGALIPWSAIDHSLTTAGIALANASK